MWDLKERLAALLICYVCKQPFQGSFCYTICTFQYYSGQIFKNKCAQCGIAVCIIYVFAVVRSLFTEFPFLGLAVTEVNSFRGMFNL